MTPTQGRGWVWIVQALSGGTLILLLGLHMVANHFVVEGRLQTYADVVVYLSNPIIFVLENLFLIVVTLHAALGVRAVLLDLGPTGWTERIINWGLTALGVVAVAYGLWLTLLIQRM